MNARTPMIKPVLIGTVETSRGKVGVTAKPGHEPILVSLSLASIGVTASQAVDLAQLLIRAARLALGQEAGGDHA